MSVDQNVINQAKKDWNAAYKRGDKAAMKAAHERAEAERAKGGYSGGADGSKNIKIKNSGSGSSSGSGGSGSKSTTKRTSTTVYDPNGNALTGYIEEGKTYLDDGSRIGDGYSVVDTSGRIWKMENGSGTLSGNIKDGFGGGRAIGAVTGAQDPGEAAADQGSVPVTAYDSYIKAMQDEETRAAQQRAEARKAQIEASKRALNEQYDNAARQAYITAEQTKREIPNMMSARGTSGGATEAELLSANTAYQNNLASLDAERMGALSKLDLSAQDVDADLADTLAGISTSYNGRLLDYYIDEQNREQQRYADTIGQYADDYQRQINALLAQGVPESDYRIALLRAARNQKIADQRQAEADARQQEIENEIAWAKVRNGRYRNGSTGSSGSSGGSGDDKKEISAAAQTALYENLKRASINDKVTPQAYINTIQKYYDEGRLTYKQAADLLNRY